MKTDKERQFLLETEFVDKSGINGTLDRLAEICYGKAAHIRENWQDEPVARAWERMARNLERLIRKATV